MKLIYAHEIKEFVKSQQNKAASINEIKTKKAAAQRTREDIQKLNLDSRGKILLNTVRPFQPGSEKIKFV